MELGECGSRTLFPFKVSASKIDKFLTVGEN
jgi:hypothetical protein